jgi:hypothetical protein
MPLESVKFWCLVTARGSRFCPKMVGILVEYGKLKMVVRK